MIRRLAKDPVLMIERGAPRRIHDEETLAQYTRALFRLTAKLEPSDAEQETIDLLTLLIEEYESTYRMQQADPVEVLKYLMEKGGLRQQDLRAELGSLSNISMILSGQRTITLGNASALAGRFGVEIGAFLPAPVGGPDRRGSARIRTAGAKAKSSTRRAVRRHAVKA